MHHRPARVIVTILAVALLATTFGGAAEGKRSAEAGLALPPTTAETTDQRAEWCNNMSNAPALRDAAADLRDQTVDDEEALAVLESASQRPMSVAAARRVGSEYAALSQTWARWNQLCVVSYAARA